MLLILLSWIYMCCIFTVHGVAANHFFKIHTPGAFLKILTGMVAQTVLLALVAFLLPIGPAVYIGNAILTLILAVVYRDELMVVMRQIGNDIANMSALKKATALVIVLTALLKCAQPPFILDNESYYLQTIRWLNEYGYVHGLANLNIMFAQTSGWHILQSGFNFSFLTDRLNDINGFLLVVFSFWCLTVNHTDHILRKTPFISMVLLFNVLLYQFINTPSPDFPVIIMAQVALFLYVNANSQAADARFIIMLLIYLVFVKIISAPLLVIALLLMYNNAHVRKFALSTAVIFALIYIGRNIILCGYPLFPFTYLRLDVDWTVPEQPLHFITNMVRNHEFMDINGYRKFTQLQKWGSWIRLGGINMIFNFGILILFAITPFTGLFRTNVHIRVVYAVLLLHFAFIMVSSPQFRFFLVEFVILSLIIASELCQRFKVSHIQIHAGLLLAALAPLAAMSLLNLKALTSNVHNQKNDKLKWSHLWQPEQNSKYTGVFKQDVIGSFRYYFPAEDYFYYATGDGPLPCTSRNTVELFAKRYHIAPALRGESLNDGFYSVNIQDDEH